MKKLQFSTSLAAAGLLLASLGSAPALAGCDIAVRNDGSLCQMFGVNCRQGSPTVREEGCQSWATGYAGQLTAWATRPSDTQPNPTGVLGNGGNFNVPKPPNPPTPVMPTVSVRP